uniref:Uncharacterized protein n=1 Tax=Timema genevievae TaxID=629358 RepID=A0A7R9K8E3_TIMGE|nr:unnamed protein product [Timema genevievae]
MEELVDQLSSPLNTSDAIMLTTLLSVLVLVAVEGTIEPLDEVLSVETNSGSSGESMAALALSTMATTTQLTGGEQVQGRISSRNNEMLGGSSHDYIPDVASNEAKKCLSKTKKRAREEDSQISNILKDEVEQLFDRG